MGKPLRDAWLTVRELVTAAGPLLLLALALLGLAYHWLDPNPPREITVATGPAQSAYDEFGQRYAAALAAHGIRVHLRSSEGAAQNLQWLREGQVDLGFVQGGSATPAEDSPALLSLGSLFVEPLWLFYRSPQPLKTLSDFRTLRINVGTDGSGVPQLMRQLFELNRMNPAELRLSRLPQTPATVAFLDGQLDALLFASAPESSMVQMLLQTPGVRLMNFAHSQAYSRRLGFLKPVTLPRGVVDLARDIPAGNVQMVATTTTLLARSEVHPAIAQLFTQAALQLHGRAGWFSQAREFPNLELSEFAVSEEAQRSIQSGIPWLQRYLPFAWANLIERMWLALGIILAVLLPLSRIVPPVYEFRMRSRVFRWYGQLRQIEERARLDGEPRAALLADLQALATKVEQVSVPLSYADQLYALRTHIEVVRKRLDLHSA